MLASLTGLLLTLGGDQPAVVFDPPLDPAIFDWDGAVLRARSPSTFVTFGSFQQKILFNEDVTVSLPEPDTGYRWQSDDAIVQSGQLMLDGNFPGECWGITGTAPKGSYAYVCEINLDRIQNSVTFIPIRRQLDLIEQVKSLEALIESCQCASDLDGDGSVGFTDLVELISVWGPCSA